MAHNYGGQDVVLVACPIFGCGKEVEVFGGKHVWITCHHCGTPWWPMELGFTGNDPDSVKEFARTHDMEGNPLK